jgi:hypothetical protein
MLSLKALSGFHCMLLHPLPVQSGVDGQDIVKQVRHRSKG